MSKSSEGPEIWTIDLETGPLRSYHWKIFDENIGLEQIDEDWSILSFAAKKLGDSKVYYYDVSNNSADNFRNDTELLKKLWDIMDRADIVIAQNGVGFDIKKLNSRMIMANMKPYSPVKVIDTMLIAKKHFGFTSNKLAYLSANLTTTKKQEHRDYPGFELWSAVLRNDKKAWKVMKEYNIHDVLATEELYLKLRPWIEGHPNVATYTDSEIMLCPKCGSANIQKRGKAYTQANVYNRYMCTSCGGWSRSKYITNTPNKRKSLLVN